MKAFVIKVSRLVPEVMQPRLVQEAQHWSTTLRLLIPRTDLLGLGRGTVPLVQDLSHVRRLDSTESVRRQHACARNPDSMGVGNILFSAGRFGGLGLHE
jgi:hypothetical protein